MYSYYGAYPANWVFSQVIQDLIGSYLKDSFLGECSDSLSFVTRCVQASLLLPESQGSWCICCVYLILIDLKIWLQRLSSGKCVTKEPLERRI